MPSVKDKEKKKKKNTSSHSKKPYDRPEEKEKAEGLSETTHFVNIKETFKLCKDLEKKIYSQDSNKNKQESSIETKQECTNAEKLESLLHESVPALFELIKAPHDRNPETTVKNNSIGLQHATRTESTAMFIQNRSLESLNDELKRKPYNEDLETHQDLCLATRQEYTEVWSGYEIPQPAQKFIPIQSQLKKEPDRIVSTPKQDLSQQEVKLQHDLAIYNEKVDIRQNCLGTLPTKNRYCLESQQTSTSCSIKSADKENFETRVKMSKINPEAPQGSDQESSFSGEHPESPDMQFFKSLLPYMSKFTELEKLSVRQKIQQIVLQELCLKERQGQNLC